LTLKVSSPLPPLIATIPPIERMFTWSSPGFCCSCPIRTESSATPDSRIVTRIR
jgi:hypothetical protein